MTEPFQHHPPSLSKVKSYNKFTFFKGMIFVLLALVCGNALLFSLAAATPLIQVDAWYFLENFLPRYFDGTLSVIDLFMQRGGTDHAQPLQKLVLLFHTHFFDMDFRVEGFIGVLFGILWCSFIASELRTLPTTSLSKHIASAVAIVLVFALGLSLNSTNLFTWPLVTLGYIALFLSTAYFLFVMHSWRSPRPLSILFASIVLGLCIDSLAIVTLIAMVLALIPMRAFHSRSNKQHFIAALFGLLIARLCLWLIARYTGVNGTESSSRSFFSMLTESGLVTGLLTPFSDSVIHIEHLARLYPDNYLRMMTLCAAIVAVLHVWFWLRAFFAWRNRHYEHSAALAVFLMLLAYGMTAAIIIGRVPVFDWNYLHQPRYVMVYQISLVAMAVMMHYSFQYSRTIALLNKLELIIVAVVMAGLLFTQIALSRQAWALPHYLTPYWQSTALAMQRVADAPQATPSGCTDIMTVCEYTPDRRAHVMAMLVEHKLNIFSTNFQMRNRLYPKLTSIPGFSSTDPSQHLDKSLRDPHHPVILTVSHALRCTVSDTPIHTTVEIQLNDAIDSDSQLWIETIGGSRQLLETISPHQGIIRFNKQLPNKSQLMLVRNTDNTLVAHAALELTTCPSSAP